MNNKVNSQKRLRRWQILTLFTLLLGYMGYYACRSNFAVVKPLLLHDFEELGIDKTKIGLISAAGTLAYAIGKIITGTLSDFVGGRIMFIFGMAASALATVFFGISIGFSIFLIAWSVNRLVQSMGWGALVKIASGWFSYQQYGRVMAILSLSFLLGDTFSRLFFGALINAGYQWQFVFFTGAVILSIVAIISWFLLRNSAEFVGQTPEVNPRNLFGLDGTKMYPTSLWRLYKPYFNSFSFWLVAVMSMGLTFMRETMNEWLNTYLTERSGIAPGTAAQYSALFPLIGALSALTVGFLTDYLTGGYRGLIIIFSQFVLGGVFLVLWFIDGVGGLTATLIIISLISFLLIGPYTFMAGAIALDLGARKGSATAVGLIDSAGYIGGMLAGYGVAKIATTVSWNSVFLVLSVAAFLTALVAMIYRLRHENKPIFVTFRGFART